MRKFQIWYMKPEWFPRGVMGTQPNATDLAATHVPLKSVTIENSTPNPLEYVYHQMQGEIWSPNGEARELIKSKGLQHTSMSVGDVIVDDVGNAHVVAASGFKAIGGSPLL
jgi:hypothetical protein